MLKRNEDIKLELENLIKPFSDKGINNFRRCRIIHDLLNRINKQDELNEILIEIIKDSRVKTKSATKQGGLFFSEINYLENNLWLCYSILDVIYIAMQDFKKARGNNREIIEKNLDLIMAEQKSKKTFDFCVWAISNKLLDGLEKAIFLNDLKISKRTYFDEKTSTLLVNGISVKTEL